MLRILRVESEGGRVVLVLHGHVSAEWVELLEHECSEAIRSGLLVSLDLAGVTFVGRSGLEALGRLSRAGIEIRGCSPLIADTLEHEGIGVSRVPDDAGGVNAPGSGGGEPDA